jgi:hypothetical protein
MASLKQRKQQKTMKVGKQAGSAQAGEGGKKQRVNDPAGTANLSPARQRSRPVIGPGGNSDDGRPEASSVQTSKKGSAKAGLSARG